MHEMGHHSFQGPLPLAGGTRTGAGIGTVFTDVFMLWFLCVVESQGTARGSILQRQKETYASLLPLKTELVPISMHTYPHEFPELKFYLYLNNFCSRRVKCLRQVSVSTVNSIMHKVKYCFLDPTL